VNNPCESWGMMHRRGRCRPLCSFAMPCSDLTVLVGTLPYQLLASEPDRKQRSASARTGQDLTPMPPDPIGLAGGLSAYGFAGGDPVNYQIPLG